MQFHGDDEPAVVDVVGGHGGAIAADVERVLNAITVERAKAVEIFEQPSEDVAGLAPQALLRRLEDQVRTRVASGPQHHGDQPVHRRRTEGVGAGCRNVAMQTPSACVFGEQGNALLQAKLPASRGLIGDEAQTLFAIQLRRAAPALARA